MRTPLGPTRRVLIRGVSLFQGLFNIRKILSGPHTVSTLQWMQVRISGVFARRGSTLITNQAIKVYNQSVKFGLDVVLQKLTSIL